ncbi:ribonuclease HIII [Niallia taxi]|uniref:ribonuclease HIII n=1 Tax=Niallia taxi TaxID=2499688 RepID=UPI002E1FC891|nr:ribonuclease HIII [Niallia taxi]MED3962832.1 ribonuclease HIII [Niallia taxi]
MITGKNKFELLTKFKSIVEPKGWLVENVKEINYGLQFFLKIEKEQGIIRIFEGKKGVRFDFSQVKDLGLLNKLEMILALKAQDNAKPVSTTLTSLDAQDLPEELIGTDESGKGDFFGPLVIAGVYVNKTNAQMLQELGVMDSKKISDRQIAELAPKIKSICPYTVVAIGNEKYNDLYIKIKNLNKLLAWGHARAIENLLGTNDYKYVLSDKFGDEGLIKKALLDKGKSVTLYQRPKAEEFISVAAASIIARNEFVNRLEKLSNKYKINLPKGASNNTISVAKEFVSKYGKEELEYVAKLHFKTIEHL